MTFGKVLSQGNQTIDVQQFASLSNYLFDNTLSLSSRLKRYFNWYIHLIANNRIGPVDGVRIITNLIERINITTYNEERVELIDWILRRMLEGRQAEWLDFADDIGVGCLKIALERFGDVTRSSVRKNITFISSRIYVAKPEITEVVKEPNCQKLTFGSDKANEITSKV